MTGQPDFFRNFGIIPHGVAPPTGIVRAYFPWFQVFGQYLLTCLMSCVGIGLGLYCARNLPYPASVLAAAASLAGFGIIVYLGTRNDYLWVELDGETLRAQHLYTGRIIERSIDEIDDLLTLVFLVRSTTTRLTEALISRVRGIRIRFHDKLTPLQVIRADPAMKNAKELIEAIIFRMSEKGEVDAEIIDFEGKPLIRRIHWKEARRSNHDQERDRQ
jgi:hypothetical protein